MVKIFTFTVKICPKPRRVHTHKLSYLLHESVTIFDYGRVLPLIHLSRAAMACSTTAASSKSRNGGQRRFFYAYKIGHRVGT